MRRVFVIAVFVLFTTQLSPAAGQEPKLSGREAELAALDARQKDMVATADIDGLAALSAPKLMINAPTDRILTRDQFLAMMRSGQIGAEGFDRKVESVTLQGDIGVVMGNEVFTPTAISELGKTYGVHPLKRRYTNVYIRDQGQWKWLARHANVVQESPVSIH